MSFTQGAPTQPLSILASNVFVTGSSAVGNAFTVQQLGTGNVASFQTSTTSTALIINPSGQVGIGKTNPAYAMDITGDLNFTGTFRQNGTPYIGSQWTGTTTLYFVGNVGIGTTTPQYRFHVTNPGPVSNIVVETDTNAVGQRSEIRFGIPAFSGTAKRAGITSNTYTADASDLQFWTNAASGTASAPQMTVTSTGNVGIGTTNPGYLLDVFGIVRAGNPVSASIYLTNSEVKWRGDGTAHYSIFNQNSTLQIRNTSANSEPGTAGSNLITINTTGSVGIGITGPTQKLDVAGYARIGSGSSDTARIILGPAPSGSNFDYCSLIESTSTVASNYASTLKFYTHGNGSTAADPTLAMTINSAQQVGIGTNSPSRLLEVYSASQNPVNLRLTAYITGANNKSSSLEFAGSDSVGTVKQAGLITCGSLNQDYTSGAYIAFSTISSPWNASGNITEYMRLNNGNLGIGTASPGSTLTVYSSNTVNDFTLASYATTLDFQSGQRLGLALPGWTTMDPNGGTTLATGVGIWDALVVGGYCIIGTSYAQSSTQTGPTNGLIVQGNVGIGITNPGFTLDVNGAVRGNNTFVGGSGATNSTWAFDYIDTGSTFKSILFGYANSNGNAAEIGFNYLTSGNTSNYVNIGFYGSRPLAVTYGGNVGIGITNPSYKLHVSNGDTSYAYYGPNSTWSSYLVVGAGTNQRAASRAQVISTNGNLHMDSGTGQIIYLNYYSAGDGVGAEVRVYGPLNVTGDITAFYSDERLKTKTGTIENALTKVCSLNAFKYVHNDIAIKHGFEGDQVQIGLSAQEVQKVLPEVVTLAPFDEGTDYDVGKGNSKTGENYLTLKYERMVPLLVEALKEERAERLRLQDRLERLEKLLSQDYTQ